MGDSFSKIVALFLALLLLFIYPTKNEFERLDETSRIFVLTETAKFVDSVRNLGYITPNMYEDFTRRLSATNNLYEIKFEHRKKQYYPVYEDPAAGVPVPVEDDEIDEDFDGGYEDVEPIDFVIGYMNYYNNTIFEVLFPDPPIDESMDRIYRFEKGDYFTVTVYNKNKTMATKLQEMLYNTTFRPEKIIVRYGGMIKDESN